MFFYGNIIRLLGIKKEGGIPLVFLTRLQDEVGREPVFARHLAEKTLTAYLFRSLGVIARWITTDLEITDKERAVIAKLLLQYVDLCNFLQHGAQDLLWHRFPGACPYCVSKKNCDCGSVKRPMNEMVLKELRQQIGKPRSVRGWQRMFQRIYREKNEALERTGMLLKLQGEVAELFELFEEFDPDPERVADELADVGARIFGLATLLGIDLQREFL